MKKLQVCLLITSFIIFSHSVQAVEFSLFGDISLSSSDADGDSNSFSLGQLDLFTEQELSETSRVTAEIVFEDPGSGFQVDIERLYVRKTITDGFKVAGGRFHTPLGMWNSNFHHGSLIQDTISRPSFLEFEDAQQGIFPAHIVGLYFDGVGDSWSYQLAFGNNSALNTQGNLAGTPLELEVKNAKDPSDEKTIIARGSFIFGEGNVELGIFTMANNVAESGIATATIGDSALVGFGEALFEQTTTGIDFRYNADRFYVFAEYFSLDTDDNQDITDLSNVITANPDSYTTTAYYLQLGVRATDRLNLIYRHEDLTLDDNNTYLDLLGLAAVSHDIIGLNYKIEESHAIKFEINKSDPEVGDAVTTFTLQWFFLLI